MITQNVLFAVLLSAVFFVGAANTFSLSALHNCFRGKSCVKISSSESENDIVEASNPTNLSKDGWEALHTSTVLYNLLNPSSPSKMNGTSAFSIMSTIRGASQAIPLEWKLYYFANLHLGLDLDVPESSLVAFRRCMYLNQSVLHHLAHLTSSTPVSYICPSLCGNQVISLTLSNSVSFPAGTWYRIRDTLQLSFAYYCLANSDPSSGTFVQQDFRGDFVPFEQAFYYQSVKQSIFDAYVRGQFGNRSLDSMSSPMIPFYTFTQLVEKAPSWRCSALALTYNQDRIRSFVPVRPGKSFILGALQFNLMHAGRARFQYRIMLRAYYDLMSGILNHDLPEGMQLFHRGILSLIGQGMDINWIFDSTGAHGLDTNHPLLVAIRSDRADILRELIAHGLNIHENLDGSDMLRVSVQSNSWNVARLLVSEGAHLRKRYSDNGDSILHIVASLTNLVISEFEMMVIAGADADATNDFGWLPVHRAAHVGNVLLLDYLIYRGNYPTEIIQDLFFLACGTSHPENILPYFIGGYAGESVNLGKADRGGKTCWNRMREGSAFPKRLDKELSLLARSSLFSLNSAGSYPLKLQKALATSSETSRAQSFSEIGYFARACVIWGANARLLGLMLSHGADINERVSELDLTCLQYAIRSRQVELIEFLIGHNATVNEDRNINLAPNEHIDEPQGWFRSLMGKLFFKSGRSFN